MSNEEYIAIPIMFRKDELWMEIFGSFNGVGEWWKSIKFIDCDWETPGTVRIEAYTDVDDNEEETVVKTLTIEDVAKAYGEAVSKPYYHCGTTVDIHSMDECASDIVLQQAVFGEVIYG